MNMLVWFNPLAGPTLGNLENRVLGTVRGAACLRASLRAAVLCGFRRVTRRWRPGRRRRGPAPAPRSLLRAAAAPAPHTPLRLLARRLAAMAEPLKSVDYEVFGRVQGTSRPREAGTGLWEGREEASALRPGAASSFWGTDFRSAMTQQPRVGRVGIARARESCGREAPGCGGRSPRVSQGRAATHWKTLKWVGKAEVIGHKALSGLGLARIS